MPHGVQRIQNSWDWPCSREGAADILVTKAGPGTIAEAMIKVLVRNMSMALESKSPRECCSSDEALPCVLTSFVPGQEEGNVTFITEDLLQLN
eukprot:3315908-Amphidinium_carterae.1